MTSPRLLHYQTKAATQLPRIPKTFAPEPYFAPTMPANQDSNIPDLAFWLGAALLFLAVVYQ